MSRIYFQNPDSYDAPSIVEKAEIQTYDNGQVENHVAKKATCVIKEP